MGVHEFSFLAVVGPATSPLSTIFLLVAKHPPYMNNVHKNWNYG